MDGKSIADAILGGPGEEPGPEEAVSEEESAEETALGATADLLLSAIEAKDRKAVVDALRALVTTIRDGG